jgi:hypothetical protein
MYISINELKKSKKKEKHPQRFPVDCVDWEVF